MSARLIVEHASELLAYDPEAGVITWRAYHRPSRRKAGDEAGGIWKDPRARTTYRRIGIDGAKYTSHRLAWLLYYGAWPAGEIDHVDGNGLNNAISNLRAATRAVNARNYPKYRNNTSGTMGVTWDRGERKWRAGIGDEGKWVHIGWFPSIAEAADARKAAERAYGYHPNHGREADGTVEVLEPPILTVGDRS